MPYQLQTAVEKRDADKDILSRAAIGTALCSLMTRLLKDHVETPIQSRLIVLIRDHYDEFVLRGQTV